MNKKQSDLQLRFQKLGIKEGDFEEKFVIGSGPGGQNLHKTASCVWLKHVPSGIEIKCQKGRLREENRFQARQLLCDIFEERIEKERLEKKKIEAKKRRETRKRSKTQKEKLVESKRHISRKKVLRKLTQE